MCNNCGIAVHTYVVWEYTGSYGYTAFLFRQADECDVVEYSITFVGVQ